MLDGRCLLEEPERPRHVLDGQAVGNGGHEMHVHLGHEVTHHRQVERLGHSRDLHPLRDAAHAQQVDHHDVDRAPLEQVTERDDAVVVLAGGDRRGERVGDAGQPRIVVVRGGIFQPVEMIRLDAPADLDGLIHRPELIDVAHEVDVRADGLSHDAHALDRGRHRRLAPALHLHLAEPHADEARPRLRQVLHRMRPHESAARIGRHAIAQTTEERAHRLAHGLALDVPARHVDGGEREREDSTWP